MDSAFRIRRPAMALAISMVAPPVLAQDVDVPKGNTLSTVTVSANSDGTTEGSGSYTAQSSNTATRMELSPRETPQSITVITRERIDDQAATTLDSLLGLTTGIVLGQYDSQRTNFYARGFAINNFQIDGMPRGPNAPLQDTYLWDRVEVVRGATGLMGGTGDPSATINMVRKRPTQSFQGNAAIRLGSWNSRRIEADISSPITEDGRIRGRAVLANEDRDSYLDLYHEKKTVGMAIVEADLTPNTLLTAGVDFQKNKPTAASWGALPYWTSTGALANFPRNTNFATNWSSWANDQETFFTSVDHRFSGGWRVHLGYSRTESTSNIKVGYASRDYPNPANGTGLRLSTGMWGESTYVNDNYDLYASGPFNLFGRTHMLIVGWNGGNQVNTSLGGRSVVPYSATIPNYYLWNGDWPEPTFVLDGSKTVGTTRLTGAYQALQLNVADKTHLILGARVSDYRTGTNAYNSLGNWTRTTGALDVKNQVTPYYGVTYDFSRELSAYASYTSVFKPQTYRDREGNYLEPITGSAAEMGVKGEFFGGLLNASAALFQSKQRNIAELDTSVPTGFVLSDGSLAYVADGDGIRARGTELEVTGEITPNWSVAAGYTFLQARAPNGDRAVPNQPRHLLQVSTAYRLSGALQGARIGAGVRAQSETYAVSMYGQPPLFGMNPPARITQPGYAVVDLMASYQINPNLLAQLNINNALDRYYYRNMGFYDGVLWGEPRNIRVSLQARF